MAPQAIGMIETKGLIGCVEACDAALKAANVRFVRQDKVGSGLVSVTVTGDVTRHASSTFSERAFCSTCGSHIWLRNTDPEETEIELFPGLFEGARDFVLLSEIYTDRAPHYATLAGDHRRVVHV